MPGSEILTINSSSAQRIAFAASLVALGNVLSRILGFIREPVVAALFGATGTADAFEVATRVPNMLFDVVVGGAISAVLVPVFSRMSDDSQRSSSLFYSLMLVVGIVAAAISGILFVLVNPLVQLLAPAFSDETHQMAVSMLRITLPAVFLFGVSAIVSGRLYGAQRFEFPSFSVAALNGSMIVGALALTPLVGPPGVALGYLIGAAAHLAIQVPGLLYIQMSRATPRIFVNTDLWKVITLYMPVLVGLIFTQFVVAVDTRLATGSGEGSLAMMRFATRLQQFPLGIVVSAVSLATLPALSRAAPERFSDLPAAHEFKSVLSGAIRYMLLLIMPATAIVVGMSEPLVRSVFQRGEFLPAATEPTAIAAMIYGIQLPLVAIDQLLIFAYYSARNTITPVLVGVAGGLVYMLIAIPAVQSFGFHGLVWANTVQNSLHALVLGILLARALQVKPGKVMLRFAARMFPVACLLVGTIPLGTWIASMIEPRNTAGLMTLVVGVVITLSSYILGLWLFRVPEARTLVSILTVVSQRLLRYRRWT